MNLRALKFWSLCLLLATQLLGVHAHAEPYLALREGLPCGACHVNPTGGGMRNTYGDVYSQTQMPQQQVDLGGRGLWLGNLTDFLRVGGNLRDDFTWNDTPHQKKADSFAIDDFRIYGVADVIQNRLQLYVDERLAPGGTQSREAYGLLWLDQHQVYIKAGQMYLPYGLRLQDDEAFVRQATGINYTTPDNGAEFGYQHGSWNAQLAITNGTAGAAENNQGKQVTGSAVYIKPGWRLGVSYSDNDGTVGKRQMGGLFGGFRTGPVAWLAEVDYIADHTVAPRVDEYAGLLEADWAFLRGNNLKLTAEYLDPDTHIAHNNQNRFSIVWEYTPMQFLQTRLGVRKLDGIPQNDLQNATEGFLEAHVFF
ncbi:MAG: hypothetical protein JWR07_4905 [Nevskia sp.]|nr:hypothetical protein [Nevskia sp.]